MAAQLVLSTVLGRQRSRRTCRRPGASSPLTTSSTASGCLPAPAQAPPAPAPAPALTPVRARARAPAPGLTAQRRPGAPPASDSRLTAAARVENHCCSCRADAGRRPGGPPRRLSRCRSQTRRRRPSPGPPSRPPAAAPDDRKGGAASFARDGSGKRKAKAVSFAATAVKTQGKSGVCSRDGSGRNARQRRCL